MNNNINIPSRVYNEEVLYVFNAYCEMAMHNFFMSMQYIDAFITNGYVAYTKFKSNSEEEHGGHYEILGFEEKAPWDGMFHRIKNSSSDPLVLEKCLNLLYKHFPFLYSLLPMKDSIDKVIEVLDKMSTLLRESRNSFEHTNKLKEEQEARIQDALPYVYAKMSPITKDSFDILNDRFHPSAKDKENLQKVIQTDTDFYNYVAFICLFLEKKYITKFTGKIGLLAYKTGKDISLILELISIRRIKMPSCKWETTEDSTALGIDILNELRKCPDELFQVLSAKDQNKFRLQDKDGNSVLMKRNHDRFAYFAMKYIDTLKILPTIRFHLSLGKYRFKFYDKYCADNIKRVRCLQKELYGFGRLQQVEDVLSTKQVWGDLIRPAEVFHKDTGSEQPYITEQHVSYKFNEDSSKIGLWFPQNNEKADYAIPNIKDKGASGINPVCWLSVYELPALLFLIHLYGKDAGEVAEKCIKNFIHSYNNLCNDIHNGVMKPCGSEVDLENKLFDQYGLKTTDIPNKLVQYLLCNKIDINREFDKWSDSYLEMLIDKNRHQLSRYKDYKDEYRSGSVASWLAKDIVGFMPVNKENTNKPTGLNYSVMQANIATFDIESLDNLKRMFTSLHIIGCRDNSMNHPFMDKVLSSKPRNAKEFYCSYLEQKEKFLSKCYRKDKKTLQFLHPESMKWKERDDQFYRELAKRYLQVDVNQKTIDLPRRIFEDAICHNLAHNYESQMLDFVNDTSKNMTFLIMAYFTRICNDTNQTFYGNAFKRKYKLLSKVQKRGLASADEIANILRGSGRNDSLLNKKKNDYLKRIRLEPNDREKKLSIEEKREKESALLNHLQRDMKNTERTIKRYKVQDIMLFLVARDLLLKCSTRDNSSLSKGARAKIAVEWDDTRDYKLSNLFSESVADDKSIMSLPITFYKDITVPIYDEKDKKLEMKTKTIWQENLKIKDYTSFYRYLYDRRLYSLFQITSENEIKREILDAELESYEDSRLISMKHMQTFVSKNQVVGSGFSEIIYNCFPNERRGKARELVQIRNAFAHNGYPVKLRQLLNVCLPQKAKECCSSIISGLNRENFEQ